MWRFLKGTLLTLLLAAATAAGIALWRSPDPLYTVQEWAAGPRYRQYDALIAETAARHALDRHLLKAVIWRESAFHADKIGTSGERGLMQVGEAAARDWANAERVETFTPTDLFDARTNTAVGAWYLARALERWKDRDRPEVFALAEYNAGRSRVDRWVAETRLAGQADADDLIGVMDFPSTRRYIEDILARQEMYTRSSRH